MKYLVFIFLFSKSLLSQQCPANNPIYPVPYQTCDEVLLASKPSVVVVDFIFSDVHKKILKETIIRRQDCVILDIDSISKSKLYYGIANNMYYLEFSEDSIINELLNSARYSVSQFCTNYLDIYKDGSIPEIDLHFIDKLTDKRVDSLKMICFEIENRYNKSKQRTHREVEINEPLLIEFKQIIIDDQRYRSIDILDLSLQNKFDSLNRSKLDSLYNLHQDELFKSQNQLYLRSMWLVLQHSTDCEWSERWFKYFIRNLNHSHSSFIPLIEGLQNRFIKSNQSSICKNLLKYDNDINELLLRMSYEEKSLDCIEDMSFNGVEIFMIDEPLDSVLINNKLSCLIDRKENNDFDEGLRSRAYLKMANYYHFMGDTINVKLLFSDIFKIDNKFLDKMYSKYVYEPSKDQDFYPFFLYYYDSFLVENNYISK